MKNKILLTSILLALSAPALALDADDVEGKWRYDAAAPVAERLPEFVEMQERDGTQRASRQCGNFETLQFADATGAEIAEDLAEQMPEVLAFSNEREFADYADFSRDAARWFKPSQTYLIASWNCGEVGGNYYFLDKKRGVMTSAGVKAEDTFVIEISR